MIIDYQNRMVKPGGVKLACASLLGLVAILAMVVLGVNSKIVLLVFTTISFIPIIFNFYLLEYLVLFFVFIFVKVLNLQVSVLLVFPLFFSFLITFRNIEYPKIKNPIIKSFLLFFLLSLPSLINASNPKINILLSANIVSFILLVLVIFYSTKVLKDVYALTHVFLGLLMIYSFYVIYLGFTSGERVFGVTGVYFVDIVGVGVIITSVLSFIKSDRFWKMLYGSLCAIFTLALLLTQTRNAWITVVATLLFACVYMIWKSEEISIHRMRVIKVFVLSMIVGGVLFVAVGVYNPSIEKRVEDVSKDTTTNSQVYMPSNSLVTRALIWDTAILAFCEHPLIGIGMYGFPYSSKEYYKIPKYLFEIYVEGLTPHQGYLGVLTEVGIVGFLGFIYFLFSIIRISTKTIALSKTEDEIALSLAVFFSLIYIVISLIFTHAWLWGQNMIEFSLLVGLSTALFKIFTFKRQDD